MGRMLMALQNPLFIVAHTTLLTNQFPYPQISELELFEGTTCLSNHQPATRPPGLPDPLMTEFCKGSEILQEELKEESLTLNKR